MSQSMNPPRHPFINEPGTAPKAAAPPILAHPGAIEAWACLERDGTGACVEIEWGAQSAYFAPADAHKFGVSLLVAATYAVGAERIGRTLADYDATPETISVILGAFMGGTGTSSEPQSKEDARVPS